MLTVYKRTLSKTGPLVAKDRARPILEPMGAKGVFDVGDAVGTASIVKLVGNFLLVSASNSLREATTMADKSGVDPTAVIDMLTQTLFPAPVYRGFAKRIAAGAASFDQTDIPIKGIGLFTATENQRANADRADTAVPAGQRSALVRTPPRSAAARSAHEDGHWAKPTGHQP